MVGTEEPASELIGRLLVSADGEPVGLITDVLIDTATRVRVATVELGPDEGVKLIPIVEIDRKPGELQVEFELETIQAAPAATTQLDYRTLPEALEATRLHFGLRLWTEELESSTPVDGEAADHTVAGLPSDEPAVPVPTTSVAVAPLVPQTSEDDDPPWLRHD